MKLLAMLSTFLLLQGSSSKNIPAIARSDSEDLLPAHLSAEPGPDTVSPATESNSLIEDNAHLHARENDANAINTLEKKQEDSYYIPDFHALCVAQNKDPSQNTIARCVNTYDRYFQHTCINRGNFAYETVSDYCDVGFFCVNVDPENNVNNQARTVKCVKSKGSGSFDTGDTGESETTPLCNKPGDGKKTFFARMTKRGGLGAAIIRLFVKKGGNTYGLAGRTTTEGTYELSYNFDTNTQWCWYGEMDIRQEGQRLTGNWFFGMI